MITGAAHKFHGPKGVGILYINDICEDRGYLEVYEAEYNQVSQIGQEYLTMAPQSQPIAGNDYADLALKYNELLF